MCCSTASYFPRLILGSVRSRQKSANIGRPGMMEIRGLLKEAKIEELIISTNDVQIHLNICHCQHSSAAHSVSLRNRFLSSASALLLLTLSCYYCSCCYSAAYQMSRNISLGTGSQVGYRAKNRARRLEGQCPQASFR